MKVTIYLADGATLDWQQFSVEGAADLRDALMADSEAPTFIQVTMDEATVLINTAQIVRVDLED